MKPVGADSKRSNTPLPTVLYVEDEQENFTVAQLRLQDKYRLIWAGTDREAVQLLTTHSAALSAILMDIHLKGSKLDGVQLTEVFRGKRWEGLPDFAMVCPKVSTPVIFVTAGGAHYPEEDLIARGGNQLVTKPVDFLKLSLALAKHGLQSVMGTLGQGTRPR